MTFAGIVFLCAIAGSLVGVGMFVFCDMYVYKRKK